MSTFTITLHGTRGSAPAPGKEFCHYGGHTSCVSVKAGDRLLILDAGTGIIPLGQKIVDDNVQYVDIFLTHAHYDHVQGLPFFAPILIAGKQIILWYAGCPEIDDGSALTKQIFSAPFLPFGVSDIPSHLDFRNLSSEGEVINLSDDIRLRTLPVNHPGGCLAIKIEAFDKSFVYAPDFEHDGGLWDERLVAFIEGATFAALDATYTAAEYESHKGFGHTFWAKSINLGETANLQKWALVHHHFARPDDQMDEIATQVGKANKNVILARDGMTFDLLAVDHDK